MYTLNPGAPLLPPTRETLGTSARSPHPCPCRNALLPPVEAHRRVRGPDKTTGTRGAVGGAIGGFSLQVHREAGAGWGGQRRRRQRNRFVQDARSSSHDHASAADLQRRSFDPRGCRSPRRRSPSPQVIPCRINRTPTLGSGPPESRAAPSRRLTRYRAWEAWMREGRSEKKRQWSRE